MYQYEAAHQSWLESIVAEFGGNAGTVHVQRGTDLFMTAAWNIPEPVINHVMHIPQGKGMAGLAQTRKLPVQTCDLQTDESGDIRPGAKAVNAKAAIALPVLLEDGEVRAVVGVAWNDAREITPEDARLMSDIAITLPP